ncbi:MAG: hypothetical protein Q7O66_07440 [Dehalococcoidia bacterium]|nr:hypothetical protein [Dehalococcoidia bacterium]
MDTQNAFGLLLAGVVAPFVVLLIRRLGIDVQDQMAQLLALGVSAVLAVGAIYATGGFPAGQTVAVEISAVLGLAQLIYRLAIKPVMDPPMPAPAMVPPTNGPQRIP